MPRIKSEILENYLEIADKVGLTKMAEDSAELQKYKDDAEARIGSDDISTIEALYGVKPDVIDEMEYKNNIMEIAHPNSVVIAPSYDKLNGLVENNIERSNIMSNIALKPNTGNHTNPKYAHQELVMELVRVGNEMDARNKEELFKLADECLIGLHKEAFSWDDVTQWFKKKVRDVGGASEGTLAGAGIGAVLGGLLTVWTGPGTLAGILGGARLGALTGSALGGIIAAFTKTEPQVKNITENAKEVITQLQDLKPKSPESASFFQEIENSLNELIKSSTTYTNIINEIHELAIKNQPTTSIDQHVIQMNTKQFLNDIALVRKLHQEFLRRVSSGQFAKANPSKILTPMYWFVDNDVEDVEKAFNSLEEAIVNLEQSTKENINTVASSSTPSTPSVLSPETKQQVEQSKPFSNEMEFFKHIFTDK